MVEPVRALRADAHPESLDFDQIQNFVAARRERGNRGQSIRKDLQALKRGLDIARRRGWIRAVPDFPKVRSDPPKETQKGQLHAPHLLRAWLDALPLEARDEAEFALLTGLRATEIKRASATWVERAPADAGVPALLRVPAAASKTRTERVVGLTAEALVILERNPNGFPETHRNARRTAAKQIAYARNITLRDLRHTYGTLALQGTGDAIAAQAALGHTELATTQRYQSSTLKRTASASIAVARLLERSPSAPSGHLPLASEGEDRNGGRGGGRHTRVGTPENPIVVNQVRTVGVAGFEPAAPCSQSRCATRLRYTPWP